MRSASESRSTTCSTPSTVTAPIGSAGSTSRSVRPVASDSPHTGDRLAFVALVRSSRSVDALGVVRSWGSTPPAPSSTTSSPPSTPTRSRRTPVASVKRIRYSVKVGESSCTSTPSASHVRSSAARRRVALGAAAGHVDVDDVARVAGSERIDVGIRHDVVGRGDDGVEVDPRCVANGAERFESGHRPILAVHSPCAPRSRRRALRPRRRGLARPPADPRLGRGDRPPAPRRAGASSSSPTTHLPASPIRRRRWRRWASRPRATC